MGEYMGTTALTCSVGGSIFSLLIMKSFILAALVSLSFAAPAPEAEAKAEAVHPLPLIAAHAPLAVLPAKQLQWPGVSAPGIDKTCFGCRTAVVVPVGRRRREAEAEADPEAEADAYYTSFNGYAHNLGSGHSYAAISSGPVVPAVHPIPAYYGYPYPYLG